MVFPFRPFFFALLIAFIGLFFVTPASADTLSFDTSFGTGGKVITSFGHHADIEKTAIQPDGKIIAVGRASNGSFFGWAIARYTPDGTLDTNFGNNGIVTKYFAATSVLNDVVIQSDGKIVVGGYSNTGAGCQTGHAPICWTVARYNINGTLDTTFGNNGVNVTPFINPNNGPQMVQSLALQEDGKIVAAGTTANVGVVRYNSDGSIDFKSDMVIIPPDFSAGNTADSAHAVRLQPDGKIVVAGTWSKYGEFVNHAYVLRLNADGQVDATFGTDGLARTSIMARDGLTDMLLQADGKIILTGGGCPAPDCSDGGDTFVARLTATGNFDTHFGIDGKVIYPIAGNDAANAVVLQTDGKILLGGYEDTETSSGLDAALRRLKPDGTPDLTFSANGSLVTPIGQNNDAISSIAQQDDGKLIATGSTSNGSYNEWVLARFSGILSNQPPVINTIYHATIIEGETYTQLGSFTDPDSTSWTGTVDYGDGSGPEPLEINQQEKSFFLNHQYTDNKLGNAPYTVTVVITDDAESSDTEPATVTVENVAPQVGAITASINPLQVNSATTVSSSFTDPAGTQDAPYIIEWDWGDGNIDTETIAAPAAVSKVHTYTTAGVYEITLTVTDKDGGAGERTFQYLSVFDATPQGLFSAGQKYTSPLGAYPQDPAATGNVMFGLSYKYQGDMPAGNRQFTMDFKEANFEFNATTVSSLVIANGIGMLRGTGTITNREGSFAFLAVGNEATDAIRIQIKDAAGNIVYDTQPGAADTASPVTGVTAGNVLAH
jgi:uncharacterized delta-60 repeat protein